jgi:phosphate starvation-inducible PhoH-like protein
LAPDENLRQVEARLNVEIRRRGALLRVIGPEPQLGQALQVLKHIDQLSAQEELTPDRVHLCIQDVIGSVTPTEVLYDPAELQQDPVIHTLRGGVRGRGANQREYLANIRSHDLTFGIGPAGTGKTYLAVACAVDALQSDRVRRIVLVRPAVEAGERLGFLPGDLTQKVDPYLRPMYDALYT